MATTTSITTTYAGEFAGEYIAAALLSGVTLSQGGVSIKPNIKFKEVIKKLALDSILKDASCDFDPTSNVTLTERILQPEEFQVNLQLCKKDFRQDWESASMGFSQYDNLPRRFSDFLIAQVAAKVAKEFNEALDLSSIILTRVDGDGRGGAALSMKEVTGKPIKLMGVGEKIDELESFHPERIAKRILGMGDIVSLVEKATKDLDEKKLKDTEAQLKEGIFTMENYLSQLRQMKKMGGMGSVMSMLPGANKIKQQMENSSFDEKMLSDNEAIILSMTPNERSGDVFSWDPI